MPSCAKCKFLYTRAYGYSSYTVENTYVLCALDRNTELASNEIDEPYDWNKDPDNDNWPATMEQRCERYEKTERSVELDVEGDVHPSEYAADIGDEAVIAIMLHQGMI